MLPSLIHSRPGARVQAGQPPSEPNRPAYQIGSAGQFTEDWSVLRGVDLGKTDDFWDRLKSSRRKDSDSDFYYRAIQYTF